MRNPAMAAAVALVAVGAFAGCAHDVSRTSAKHGPTTGATAVAGSPSPSPSPVLSPTAPASTPLGAGQRVWAAFAQRGLPYDAWWAQLSPLLSDAARAVYVYDDPRNIPAMALAGALHLAAKAPAQAGYTAEVLVPTSKGVFGLDLERHTLRAPWLLYAIKFPPAVK